MILTANKLAEELRMIPAVKTTIRFLRVKNRDGKNEPVTSPEIN